MKRVWIRHAVRDARGLALVDVLLGMAIFALVAVIAIQAGMDHRARAHELKAVGDASAIGDSITGSEDYITSATPMVLGGGGFRGMASTSVVVWTREGSPFASVADPVEHFKLRLSQGNTLKQWTTNDTDFGFCVEHESGAWATYRTDRGGIDEHGRSGGCPEISLPGGTQPGAVSEEPEPTPEPTPTSSPAPTPTGEPAVTEPEETPAPTPTVAPSVRDWDLPTSEHDIMALCARDWGSRAIYGHFGVVYGTEGADVIFTGNGSQTVYGLGGDDLICGGNGDDYLYGGKGRDIIYGGNGKDVLHGGPNVDYLYGGNGKDDLAGGGAIVEGEEDDVYGGWGTDHLFGGNSKDSFYVGAAGLDVVHGGNGKSYIFYDDIPDPTP